MNAKNSAKKLKIIIGGILLTVAFTILIISATKNTAAFYLSVNELQGSSEQYIGKNLRVSGAVLGTSISYSPETEQLYFTIVHIPEDDEIQTTVAMEAILHAAVNNPESATLDVIYDGPRPEMLKDESQAIVTGTLNEEGVFVAEELLLKCPSKYEEAAP